MKVNDVAPQRAASLQTFLGAVAKIPVVTVGLGAVQVVSRAATSLPFEVEIAATAILTIVAAYGRYLLRPGPATVRRILLEFLVCGWTLGITIGMLGWTVAELGNVEPLLRIRAPLVAGSSAGVTASLAGYFLTDRQEARPPLRSTEAARSPART